LHGRQESKAIRKLRIKEKSSKVQVELEHTRHKKIHTPFEEGNLVLLRDLEITIPPDKPNPWWYGPFTIKNISQGGIATLSSQFGGEKIASIDRLRHYCYDSEDPNYLGCAILRDGIT
jgi:hypothetical protein